MIECLSRLPSDLLDLIAKRYLCRERKHNDLLTVFPIPKR
jgi:hypothetical protein